MTYEFVRKKILSKDFHAIEFSYNGVDYSFAGWWILCVGYDSENDIEFDSVDEFLTAKVFDGKTFEEIFDEIDDIYLDAIM